MFGIFEVERLVDILFFSFLELKLVTVVLCLSSTILIQTGNGKLYLKGNCFHRNTKMETFFSATD